MNVEVYIDDMVIKTKSRASVIEDTQETFSNLRKYNLKLNPKKCTFRVPSGKFLDFMVSQCGLEANPDKIKAVINMKVPANIKDVQRLNGHVAEDSSPKLRSAACHSSRLSVRTQGSSGLPNAKTLLTSLRSICHRLPSYQFSNLPLSLFIGHSVCCLGRRHDNKIQRPVYYVSRILHDTETRYPELKKFIFVLVVTARRLRTYFQAHPIIVLSDQPLREVFNKPDLLGRLVKWVIKLGEYGLQFEPRRAIKAQVLADFIAEASTRNDDNSTEKDKAKRLVIYVNGSSNQLRGGADLVITGPCDFTLAYALRFDFKASNNEAEYEALITALKISKALRNHALDSI